MSKERDMIDLVRSIMYSAADCDNENLYAEVEDLGRLLGKYDGVPYDPTANRLIKALDELKKKPRLWKKIEHLND